MSNRLSIASVLLLIVTFPLTAQAQANVTGIAVRDAKAARSIGNASGSARVLGQEDRRENVVELNALADSLVAIVLTDRTENLRGQQLRSSAIGALTLSGTSRAKVPFGGAGARLFQIAQRAPDVGDRAAAVYGITELADANESVTLLRRVATSENPAALAAIRALWDLMPNNGGLATLRELSVGNQVRDPDAARELDRVARKYKWK